MLAPGTEASVAVSWPAVRDSAVARVWLVEWRWVIVDFARLKSVMLFLLLLLGAGSRSWVLVVVDMVAVVWVALGWMKEASREG